MNNKLKVTFLYIILPIIPFVTVIPQDGINIKMINTIKHPSLSYNRAFIGIQTNDSLRDKIIFNYDYVYRQSVINPFLEYNNTIYNRESIYYLTLNKFKLSLYQQRTINWGLGDINNTVITIHWSPFNKFTVEAGGLLSMQYGYMLFSKSATYGASLKLNYEINNQLNFYVWGQYMFNRNSDSFMKYMYTQPKTGLGVGVEYKPSKNINIGISAGKQEDVIDKRKYNITIEGKAGLKF